MRSFAQRETTRGRKAAPCGKVKWRRGACALRGPAICASSRGHVTHPGARPSSSSNPAKCAEMMPPLLVFGRHALPRPLQSRLEAKHDQKREIRARDVSQRQCPHINKKKERESPNVLRSDVINISGVVMTMMSTSACTKCISGISTQNMFFNEILPRICLVCDEPAAKKKKRKPSTKSPKKT